MNSKFHFQPLALAALCTAASLAPPSRASGQDLFLKHCISCHGKDGKGNTPAGKKFGAKDLTASKTTPAEIEKQVSLGKREPNGQVKMPPFADKLSTAELKEISDYVLKLRK